MSINKTRGTLYKLARILGDVQAVRTGRVGRRVGRRVAGRLTGRGLGRLFR
jgi:ubiquinone biosynthesis protein UbiJ